MDKDFNISSEYFILKQGRMIWEIDFLELIGEYSISLNLNNF